MECISQYNLDDLRESLTTNLREALRFINAPSESAEVAVVAVLLNETERNDWLAVSSTHAGLRDILSARLPDEIAQLGNGWYSEGDQVPTDGITAFLRCGKPADDKRCDLARKVAEIVQQANTPSEVSCSELGSIGDCYIGVLAIVDTPKMSLLGLSRFVVDEFIAEAISILKLDPYGSSHKDILREPQEIVRKAARGIVEGLFRQMFWRDSLVRENMWVDAARFITACDAISVTRYEQSPAFGEMLITPWSVEDSAVNVKFPQPVPIDQTRQVRKLLETVRDGGALVSDGSRVIGIAYKFEGAVESDTRIFQIRFVSEHVWRLQHGSEYVMQVRHGHPEMIVSPFDPERFLDLLRRTFSQKTFVPHELLAIAEQAVHEKHGTMLVITDAARTEAERLSGQCFRINPLRLPPRIAGSLMAVDGALIIDVDGTCHAFGAILDGAATGRGNPARGARYNSAVKYKVSGNAGNCLIAVFSTDGTVDLLSTADNQDAEAAGEQTPVLTDADLRKADPNRRANPFLSLDNAELRAKAQELVDRLKVSIEAHNRIDQEYQARASAPYQTPEEEQQAREASQARWSEQSQARMTLYHKEFKEDALALRDAMEERLAKPFTPVARPDTYLSPVNSFCIKSVIEDLELRISRLRA